MPPNTDKPRFWPGRLVLWLSGLLPLDLMDAGRVGQRLRRWSWRTLGSCVVVCHFLLWLRVVLSMLQFGPSPRWVGHRRRKLRSLRGPHYYEVHLWVRREGRRREWRTFEEVGVVILVVLLLPSRRHLIWRVYLRGHVRGTMALSV